MSNQFKKPNLKDLAPFGPFEFGGTRYHEYRRRWLAGERPMPNNTNGYFIRVKHEKPISLIRKTNGKTKHLLGLDTEYFDREVWFCKEPWSPRLSVAIEWFLKRSKRKLDDIPKATRLLIRKGRKNGASIETLAKNYKTTRKIVRKIIH